jgi:hypothetical protein
MDANASEVGSVEGLLEVISVHGQETIKVWDARFGIAVSCHVSSLQIEEAKQFLGRRVAVRGRILHEHNRPKEVIDVFDIRALLDKDAPQIESFAPIDLMGGEEPADYLRGDEE